MACLNPQEILVKQVMGLHEIKRSILVPCGKCTACISRKKLQYALRMEYESRNPKNRTALFVTLTYDNEHLPEGNVLSKDDVKKFFVRLRRNLFRSTGHNVQFRYFLCGEYGSLRGRAHYHFYLASSEVIDYSIIRKSWLGDSIVDIKPVYSSAGFGYLAKYMTKQSADEMKYKQPPFFLCSNGLGDYFLELYGDYIIANNIAFWRNDSGAIVAIPRYYIDKLYPPTRLQITRMEYSSSFAFAGNRLRRSNDLRVGAELALQMNARKLGLNPFEFDVNRLSGLQSKDLRLRNNFEYNLLFNRL